MTKTYEDGVQDGRIDSLEAITHRHDSVISDHDGRLRLVEKIVYGLVIITAITNFPMVISLLPI